MTAKKYAGADFVKESDPLGRMSTLGEAVADILGQVQRGIYHNSDDTARVDWGNGRCITVPWSAPLSTFDYGTLTELVVLCHDRAIRLEIQPQSSKCVRLLFHQRRRDGDLSLSQRMPTLEQNTRDIRERIGLGIVPSGKETT